MHAGFTLVELIVVMTILAILGAIAVTALPSARTAASRTQVVTAGRAVDEAIKAFRLDHASRVPVLGDASDWPDAKSGPIDDNLTSTTSSDDRRYMRRIPDVLATGDVTVAASTGAGPRLVYELPAGGYRLTVVDRKGTNVCWFGSVPASGLRKC